MGKTQGFRFANLILVASLLLAVVFWWQVFPVAADQISQTAGPVLGDVGGTVVNMTAGGQLPADQPVTLFVLEGFEPTGTYTGTLAADGSFLFQSIPLIEGQTFIATLEYAQVSYGSAFVEYDGFGDSIQLAIEVYEPNSEPDDIGISRLHVIIDFDGDGIQVSELYIFDNLGDRAYVGPSGVPGNGTLEVPLPAGALMPVVQRAMGESMVPASSSVFQTDDGFVDTLPVRPGTGAQQLMLSYGLAYENEVEVSHPLLYPVESVSLILPDAGVSVESALLSSGGDRAMQGMRFIEWSASNVPAGEVLSFRLSGEVDLDALAEAMPVMSAPAAPSKLSVAEGDNPTSLVLGGVVLVVSLAVIGLVFRRGADDAAPESREGLLEQVCELDAAFEDGQISQARYEWEREQIISALRRWYEQ